MKHEDKPALMSEKEMIEVMSVEVEELRETIQMLKSSTLGRKLK